MLNYGNTIPVTLYMHPKSRTVNSHIMLTVLKKKVANLWFLMELD